MINCGIILLNVSLVLGIVCRKCGKIVLMVVIKFGAFLYLIIKYRVVDV